jgi:hypothetical protein
MIPGISRNWRRTSKTTAPAARDTALTASPENMNTTAAPIMTPTSTFGSNTVKLSMKNCCTSRFAATSPSDSVIVVR